MFALLDLKLTFIVTLTEVPGAASQEQRDHKLSQNTQSNFTGRNHNRCLFFNDMHHTEVQKPEL